MRSKKRVTLAVTSLILITLANCAGVNVHWWFLDSKEFNALIRRDQKGNVSEKKEFIEADGFFCLNQADARTLVECCANPSGSTLEK